MEREAVVPDATFYIHTLGIRLGLRPLRAEAKVGDFQRHVILSVRGSANHEEILGLKISVDHAVCVQVLDAVEDLVNQVHSILLREVSEFNDAIKQLASASQLLHQVHCLVVLAHLDQGDAARMIDCFHDVDLVLQRDGVEVGWSRISDWTATF
jgi:hypothetical protein